MQHPLCVLHASEARPSGPLEAPLQTGLTVRSTPRDFAEPRPPKTLDPKADAKRGLAQRAGASVTGGVPKWPAGPGVRSTKNEPNGFAISPFALVTFIWGRK